jgi:hypothetical protein
MKDKIKAKPADARAKKPPARELKGPGHYVPQFWIKGFAGPHGRIIGRKRGDTRARQVSASDIMAEQGAYTMFDQHWRASDLLEDLLANKHEGGVAKLFRYLHDPSADLLPEVRSRLCHAVAVAACRLPHVMRWGFRLSNEFISALRIIPDATSFESLCHELPENFAAEITRQEFDYLRGLTPDQFARSIEQMVTRSPQNPAFSEQDTLVAAPVVTAIISDMDLTLLDAPAGSYILGDTPVPDRDLAHGFTLPLSASLALSASPKAAKAPVFARRNATTTEIKDINQTQFDNLVDIVVGARRDVLEAF